jgi:hypothetical protein
VTFCERAGPTALRADLVRALSFSAEPVRLEPTGTPATGAIAAVWNGERGLVVLIVREIEPAAVRRFEFELPIESVADLDGAIERAHEFAEQLGFYMDAGEFSGLDPEAQSERIAGWNALRKLARRRRAESEATPELETAAQAAAEERPQAVLGKIALVRRERPSALARILGFF